VADYITDGIITSSMEGLVMSVNCAEGDTINAGSSLVTLAARTAYVILSVSQDDIADLELGMEVQLAFDACEYQTFWDYHDGWCYFDVHKEGESVICRVAAISLDGEQKEILALTSNNETEETPGYTEEICQIGTDGDRIYIVYGGYAGTGHFYQGGRIITTKLDGSDYRAMECEADSFYVCHDGGRTLVYVPRLVYVPDNESGYEATVWDVEENRVFPSDFPQRLIWGQKRHEEMPYREYMPPRPLCIV